MRSWLPTFIALILCIGGFWYASTQDFFREQSEEATYLFQINADDVTSIQIVDTDGAASVKLLKEDADWRMELPDPYPLYTYSVDEWLTSLGELTITAIAEEDADDLGKYGLKTPLQYYEVELKDGTKLKLEVGDETPVTGTVYARIEGSHTVYVLSQTAIHSLQMTALDFVQKDPIVFLADQVTAIDWNWSDTSIQGARNRDSEVDNEQSRTGSWRINDTKVAYVDAIAWLNQLRFQETDQMPRHRTELESSGVVDGSADFTLLITLNKSQSSMEPQEETVHYQGYREEDRLWILSEGSEWAYAVPSAAFDELNAQMEVLLDTAKESE